MAFYNFPKSFEFEVNIDEFIKQIEKSYLGKDVTFKINYRWLHETILKWQKKIENSELFDERDLDIILPIWILYFHKLLKLTANVQCFQTFLKYAIFDFKKRQYLFNDELKNWNMLIESDIAESLFEFCGEEDYEDEVQNENVKEESECHESKITIQSLDSTFLIKCNFMLDLFVPNRFQYTIFRAAFNPTNTMVQSDKPILSYPYNLQFFTTTFLASSRLAKAATEEQLKLKLLPLQEANETKEFFEHLNENIKKQIELDKLYEDAKINSQVVGNFKSISLTSKGNGDNRGDESIKETNRDSKANQDTKKETRQS